MTKTIALPLILAATLGLAACGHKTDATAENSTDAAVADINVATDEAVSDVNAAAADATMATGNAVDATANATGSMKSDSGSMGSASGSMSSAGNANVNTTVENATHDKE